MGWTVANIGGHTWLVINNDGIEPCSSGHLAGHLDGYGKWEEEENDGQSKRSPWDMSPVWKRVTGRSSQGQIS